MPMPIRLPAWTSLLPTAALILVVLSSLCAAPVLAWGTLGHQAVAQVAYNRLSSTARTAVDRYLNGETLETASVYPDTFRANGGDWSGPLHYVNFPNNAVSYQPPYCGDPPMCVVTAVNNYTNLVARQGLRGPLCTFARGDTPCPLSFLIHFVGDIHQPLHNGYAEDKDGNDVVVRTFWGKTTNLHALWDTDMLQRYQPSLELVVELLEDEIDAQPEKVKKWLSVMSSVDWTNEGFTLVKTVVYHFDQAAAPVEITEQYYASNIKIVVERLAMAGVRLAALINTIFQII